MSSAFNLLIGTYTTGDGQDIAVYRLDRQTARLYYLNSLTGINNPSYFCVAGNGRFIYAVNENTPDQPGGISAFSCEPDTGTLKLINQQATAAGPCYISIDSAQKHLFAANYAAGSLTVLALEKDGSLLPAVQTIQLEGHGKDLNRQEKPHIHCAILSPDEQYLLFTDLGTDKIYFYQYEPLSSTPIKPTEPSSLTITPGHGPRHIAFAPNGRYFYLITEMGGYIYCYAYDGPQSKLLQMVNLVSEDFKGTIAAADIQISPDGRFLFASNRGDANEIVVYAINANTGLLSLVERKSSQGKEPRSLVIDPSGKFLLVANQQSNDIYSYVINKDTGRLTPTNFKISISQPCCLKFTPAY